MLSRVPFPNRMCDGFSDNNKYNYLINRHMEMAYHDN